MGVLKQKLNRHEISPKAYISNSRNLIRKIREDKPKIINGDFISHSAFAEAERMVSEYSIDFIDAFQIISCKSSWTALGKASELVLVTADLALSKASDKEGIKCWYCRETHEPIC